jgi:hypothetical protein
MSTITFEQRLEKFHDTEAGRAIVARLREVQKVVAVVGSRSIAANEFHSLWVLHGMVDPVQQARFWEHHKSWYTKDWYRDDY